MSCEAEENISELSLEKKKNAYQSLEDRQNYLSLDNSL